MSMFSPLALTQALPFLPLAQGDIDYQVDRRNDPDLFASVLSSPVCTVMLVDGGKVAVPKGQGDLVDYDNVKLRLATLPGAYVLPELASHPQAVPMFLGSYGGARAEQVVAVDVTRLSGLHDNNLDDRVPDSAYEGADDAFGATTGDAASRKPRAVPSALEQAAKRFDWVDLRGFAPHASAREAGQATTAASLSVWHMRQRHCPTCGAEVKPALGGWAQRCTNAADGNRLLFPRIEPAVIVSVVDSQDRLLLQHNRAWQTETMYSVSAGFVEAGENLEHACRRETREETGIELGEVKYLGSQPWPFPASLMVAFKARALSTDIRVDGEETGDARWFTRDEYEQAIASGEVTPPVKAAIARYMIEEWLGHEL